MENTKETIEKVGSFITVKEGELMMDMKAICELLGLNEKTVRKIPASELPVYRTQGNHRRYKYNDVKVYAERTTWKVVKDEPKIMTECTFDDIRFSSGDFKYFFTRFCTVVKNGKRQLLNDNIPYKFLYFTAQNHPRLLITGEHGVGKTYLLCAYVLWLSLFKKDISVAYFGCKLNSIKYVHDVLTEMYNNLPKELQGVMSVADGKGIEKSVEKHTTLPMYKSPQMRFNTELEAEIKQELEQYKLITFLNGNTIKIIPVDETSFQGTIYTHMVYDEPSALEYNRFINHWNKVQQLLCNPQKAINVVMASSQNSIHYNYFDMLTSGAFNVDIKTMTLLNKNDPWTRCIIRKEPTI